ncbi:pyruvate formate-lyase-activating protein [Clostridium estertheticum]|uniref:Pyruvate formate-lyase-activating enzyme n=1 Tax=Clostridium estertheticum TaxID=238834 RepID=A0A5N7J5M2_9CLOT|nr:pyruvate formate-lyase-activating protein [Clostridium estertheticum]MBU3172893.1 pyruvate formate lyase-activating protein [Clostridium estertheticum]MBU3184042.1 pyruvate formate lyase-activating protein [Clostridium estertheticum]MCB2339478.1 pyruvate formate lyase-activating protein [Clostridium estertheticum]MPQ33378.1 pyruvate formate lyase-activating protein [Clostridium estertheticum]MPQ64036.1 pyruvate formate lyase-activating protein [Clostridium estertheticum]
MVKGKIHSIETMGLVDGPGIRVVVFFQGCKLRCAYCHNPDTWQLSGGTEMTPDEIVKKIVRFKPYFNRSGGGVTFSGGDPLLQSEFLLECLKLCKQNGIHTALDTAGFGDGNYDEILKYTDLVLLDIKQTTGKGYVALTGKDTTDVNIFLESLRKSKSRVWVRHVVVPGITDSEEHITKLAKIINEEVPNLDKVELLSYHVLGVSKYEELSIPYKLKGVEAMDKDKTKKLQTLIDSLLNIK